MAAKAGRLQIQLEMQVAQLQRDLAKATAQIDSAANNWKSTFKGTFTADLVTQFTQRLGAAIAGVIDDMGAIADGAAGLGDTAEMFQKISVAAEMSGVSMESVTSASNKLQKQLGEGSKATEEALNRLGLKLADVRNMSTGNAFIAVAGRLGEVKDASLQAALAADTMGKGFAAVKPFAAQGEQAMRQVVDAATAISDAAVAAGDDFGDAMGVMQHSVKLFLSEALQPLLPLLTRMVKDFTDVNTQAAGAADGIDRTTSKARQLGEAVADTLQSLDAFHDLMGSISSFGGLAFQNLNPFKSADKSAEYLKQVQKNADDVANAYSRMTTHFNGVQATVTTTAELATNTRKVADASEDAETKTKGHTRALKEQADQQVKMIALDKLLADSKKRVEDSVKRTTDLTNDQNVARMEAMGISEDEIELWRMQLEGYNDAQIRIAAQTQQIRAGTAERAEDAAKLADEQQHLADTMARGFDDIFMSMTEGADQTKEAVARLVTELAAMYVQMVAMQLLKGFNSDGSWGFQGVAKGGVFDQNGMMKFAQGGVVSRATAFSFGGGRLGVMGEAGPEAIMPLGRDSNGRLGVRGGGVNVNVHNYGGSQVDVQRNGTDVAIIIDQVRGVIANDFARGGNKVTTALEGAYGVRR